jgi:hypothetical protein
MAAALLCGCTEPVDLDPGLSALLQVNGAEFRAGPMPRSNGGPAVSGLTVSSSQVVAGSREVAMRSFLEKDGTAGLVGLSGDSGYWVVVAGPPPLDSPDSASLEASLSFSGALEEKPYRLRVEGVNAEARIGKPAEFMLTGVRRAVPQGTLVVSLSWDTEADLDLHVVLPNKAEIFARDINSLPDPSPGKPVDPEAYKAGGILDFDSNANCDIDGLRQENVYFTAAPPSGHYLARVDTFSLCSAPAARWKLSVMLSGRVVARAEGDSGPGDVALPHDRGGGVLALEFDVP